MKKKKLKKKKILNKEFKFFFVNNYNKQFTINIMNKIK